VSAAPDVRPDVVRGLLAECEETDGAVADQTLAGRILEAYGIPVTRVELARTVDEAVAAARRMGFPVALKIASPDIAHKSEVGGVVLDVADGPAVAEGFAGIVARARAARPRARILGVHVQPMLPPGQEVIVGAIQDPQFKALVMFGSGGVEVESLRDVAFALAPLSRDDADHMLESTWAGRRLRGYRHLPPADRDAVREVVLRLGHLAADFPEIAEIEVNPLRVLPGRGGAVAVDVRLRVGRVGPPAPPAPASG
jgi:acetyltransferase